jgi:hypothetical protein
MERQGMAEPDKPRPGRMSGADSMAVAPIVATLGGLRTRARLLLVAAAIALVLAVAIAAVLSAGVLDYLLRTPMWMRLGLLFAGLAALVLGVYRYIAPAIRFNPTLTEVALRVERSKQGRDAGLQGVLASGLELAQDPPASPIERGLAAKVIASAVSGARRVRASAVLNPAPARHGLVVLAVCILSMGAISLMVGPALMTTGALRIFAPWSGAEWPKRTAVVDATTVEVHPLGTALPLRAAVTRSDRAAEQTRVGARYRLVTAEGADAWRRVVLAWQGHEIGLDPATGPANGQLFERLIEPSALAAAAGVDPAAVTELEYHFETDDDRTAARRIRLVHPPSLLTAQVTITPPEYARGVIGAETGRTTFVHGRRDLGAGNDQRAVVGPVLAGSTLELQMSFNKALPLPPEGDESGRRDWMSRVLPGLAADDGARAAIESRRWTITWPAAKSVRIGVDPRDEFGIGSQEEAAYSFDVVEDREPAATVVEPSEDEAVLATAVVEITGEARDDVGVQRLALERQIARPARGSAGAAAEATEEPGAITAREWGEGRAPPMQATVSSKLDLGPLELKPRDEVWVTAVVQDNFLGAEGRREAVRSSPRRLRIISEEELVDQVRSELGALRRVAMRLDEEQGDIQTAARTGEISQDDARRQSGLTQRIAQQRTTVERLQQRMERNRLEDEVLAGLLDELEMLMRGARRDSDRAAGAMQSATANEEESAALTPEQAQAVEEAQEAVREQLGRMAEMLDRGEDSWVMSRALQRMLQQQRDLQAQTERLGERTMGRRAEDLSAEERAELQRLQERQEQLAESMRQTLDDLEERARQMQNADPAQAAAMQQAAQRGREQQVQERMQEAAENLEENQTSTATSQQQEAIDALQQMVEDMNDAQRQRDQALRRTLANLIQSLERLVGDQAQQIGAIEQVLETGPFDGLDSAMILINQNTLAVSETARSDRATASVAEPVDRAARAQSDAIAALRASPVNAALARQHEQESLRLLQEALEEARRLQRESEQRDQQRQRDALKKIYREALEEQVALRAGAEQYLGRQVDRRDRIVLRALGERQESLRVRLQTARRDIPDIEDAAIFAFAHDRLDAAAASAGKKLRAGQADASVKRHHDSLVQILSSLVEALNELERDDEFRDEEGGEGGGSGGQGGGGGEEGLLPPITELRLLRGMQQEAAGLTRALHEAQDASVQDELGQLAELQRVLAERGSELVEKLQPRRPMPGAGGREGGGEPADPQEPGGPEPGEQP